MNRKLILEETKKCLTLWREFRDKDALTLLTVCNSRLVKYIAKKYIGKGLTFEELLSAGNEGLINAINKFNYLENDIEVFSTYTYIAIKNSMLYELRKYQKHSHVLSLNQPIEKKDDEKLKLEDIIGTSAEGLLEEVISEMKNDIVKDVLKSLTSREQQIILLRYGLDAAHQKTQEEVAKIFGCGKATIAKQEKKALIKMRHPRNTRKLKDFLED